MRYLGVDPGLDGAIALIEDGRILGISDVPTFKTTRGMTKRKKGIRNTPRIVRELDEEVLAGVIDAIAQGGPVRGVMEKVGSMKDQGIASAFAFGQVYGGLKMALGYAGIPYESVTPQRWKLAMGCGADKESSLVACLREFPEENDIWFGPKQGILDGRCEAALIALWGSRQ